MAARESHNTAGEPDSAPPGTVEVDTEVLPPPSDPMAVARALVLEWRYPDGTATLRRWNEAWMRWEHTHWREMAETEVRAWTYKRTEHAHYLSQTKDSVEERRWAPNRAKIADLLDALASICHLPSGVEPPTWLDGEPTAGPVVACTNGLLHLTERRLTDLTPRYFNVVSVPFDYAPDADCPRWCAFLDQIWPDDADAIAALQQWFGYVLSGRTDLHKILLIVGPTRSGKGTIARVLAALVGSGNVAGPTLRSLGTDFGLSPLIGKPLAVISDARLSGRDSTAVVERLLTISGEDTIDIDRKYRQPWTGRLGARFTVMSNELPHFGDASGVIARRFLVLTMTRSWLGRENTALTEELTAELPGILNWALAGLDKLTAQGRLTEPATSAQAVTTMLDMASPTAAFVRDACTLDAEHTIAVDDLWQAWKDWCEDNGRSPGTKATFGRNLQSVAPQLRKSRLRATDGTRVHTYTGITLSDTAGGVAAEEEGERAGVVIDGHGSGHGKNSDPWTGGNTVNSVDVAVGHGGHGGHGKRAKNSLRENVAAPDVTLCGAWCPTTCTRRTTPTGECTLNAGHARVIPTPDTNGSA